MNQDNIAYAQTGSESYKLNSWLEEEINVDLCEINQNLIFRFK